MERRSEFRTRNVYRICTVEYRMQTYISILRNNSDNGAQIEMFPDMEIAVGDMVTYCRDEVETIHGQVIWQSGNVIGVRNVEAVEAECDAFPPRAIRATCALPCRVIGDGQDREAVIVNISLTGVLVSGLEPPPIGSLATITVKGLSLCNSSARWSDEGVIGFRFERPLRIADLARLFGSAA